MNRPGCINAIVVLWLSGVASPPVLLRAFAGLVYPGPESFRLRLEEVYTQADGTVVGKARLAYSGSGGLCGALLPRAIEVDRHCLPWGVDSDLGTEVTGVPKSFLRPRVYVPHQANEFERYVTVRAGDVLSGEVDLTRFILEPVRSIRSGERALFSVRLKAVVWLRPAHPENEEPSANPIRRLIWKVSCSEFVPVEAISRPVGIVPQR